MSLKSSLLAACASLALVSPAIAQEIEIHDPYARSASPMARSGAAFMVIHNHGDADDHLVGAHSPAAQRVELHTHLEEDGVMRMIHVEDGLALPANGEILMQRGGHHVMFMGLNGPLEQGGSVPLTLVFGVSGEITLDVPVDLERRPEDGHGHGHDTGHDHADDHTEDHSHDH